MAGQFGEQQKSSVYHVQPCLTVSVAGLSLELQVDQVVTSVIKKKKKCYDFLLDVLRSDLPKPENRSLHL